MGNDKRKLQPWEAKLIGRQDRFAGTLSYWFKTQLKEYGAPENAKILTDAMFDYLNKGVLNVDVNQYEIFGKKIDRPWNRGAGAFYTLAGLGLGSDFVKKKVRETLDSSVFNPNQERHYSGAEIAAEIFVPTLMQKDKRPSCHFEEAYLAEFYNDTGIVLDEAAMISDMMQVTMGIADSNYTDSQWRTDVLPFIIRGSYQKNLKEIFEKIQDEALNNPGISREMIEDRMDKAQKALGKIYEDFSLTIANTTDYLEAPLKITDDGVKAKPADNLEEPLNKEELKKYEKLKQYTLIDKKELKSMKEPYLKKAKALSEQDIILNFYQSFSGSIGPEDQRTPLYEPKPLEGSDAYNQRVFLASTASLAQYRDLLANTKQGSTQYRSMLETYNLMLDACKNSFALKDEDIAFLGKPGTKTIDIKNHFKISDEAVYGFEKISPDKMPKLTPMEERENSYVNIVKNLFPDKETIKNTFYTAKDLLYKAGEITYEVGKEVVKQAGEAVKNVGTGIKDIYNGNILSDLDLSFDDDILDDLGKSGDERRSDFEQDQAKLKAEHDARLKRLEEEQKAREAEEKLLREKWEQRLAEEKALEEKNAVLDSLEPWQQKVVGHKDRYTDTWLNSMLVSVSKSYGGSIDAGIDSICSYFGNSMAPEVKSYQVYGQKLKKAWGTFENISGDVLKLAVNTDAFKNIFKNKIKSLMLAPGSVQYTSGEQVAMECFSPSYLQGELRPPIHFNEAYLAEFYNETGIYPNETAMIGEMMAETLKIKDNNYTDEQWRQMIMPEIIKGSYRTQLANVCNVLQNEYLNNPGMSQQMYEQRLEKASTALGKIYEDFTKTLANKTEYLGAPMSLTGTKNPPLSEAQLKAMTPEQIKKYNSAKTQSISSKSEIEKILSKAKKVQKASKDIDGLLSDFISQISGFVVPGEDRLFDSVKPYNDPTRSPGQDKAFIASVITARKANEIANKRGFFSKLFHKKAAEHEQLVAETVRETLKNVFKLDQNVLDDLLNPKTNVNARLSQLGFNEESVLGYKKMEVPDPKIMAEKQKNLTDMYKDWVPTIKKYSVKAVGLAKGVVSGGYKLAVMGAGFVVKGVKGLYNYYFNGNENDPNLVDKEPSNEELDQKIEEINQNQLSQQNGTEEIQNVPSENQGVLRDISEQQDNSKVAYNDEKFFEPEEELFTGQNISEENKNVPAEKQDEVEKQQNVPSEKQESMITEDMVKLEDEPEEEQDNPEEEEVFYDAEGGDENQEEPEEKKDVPAEKQESMITEDMVMLEDEPEEKKDVPVEKQDEPEKNQDEPEEEQDNPEEEEVFYDAEGGDEKQDEPEEKQDVPVEQQDEPEKEQEEPEEEIKLDENEELEADSAGEKDVDDLVGEIQEEQTSMLSFSYWTSGWFSKPKTADQLVTDIDAVQAKIINDLSSVDLADTDRLMAEMSKLQYTQAVKSFVKTNKWSVKQAEAALKPENMQERSLKFVKSDFFKQAYDSIISKVSDTSQLKEMPTLAEDIFHNTILSAQKIQRQQKLETKKENKKLEKKKEVKKPEKKIEAKKLEDRDIKQAEQTGLHL